MKSSKLEPLQFLHNKYGFQINKISEIVSGSRYTAVLSIDGNIGVCANFGTFISDNIESYSEIDFSNLQHRILLNAYFNSTLNYENSYDADGDIFDIIDFNRFEKITMIGLFRPIARKFAENNILVDIFDKSKGDSELLPMDQMNFSLENSNAVILTATSIFNNTFNEIITMIPDQTSIYILGPSSIMADEFFEYQNIKAIFGTTFEIHDHKVLSIIADNGGTRQFIRHGHKRVLKP